MNTKQQVLIISAELATLSDDENLKRSINLELCLNDTGMIYTKTQGSYKGVDERSFLVVVKNETDIDIVRDFAFKNFNQELILYQDANGLCHLEYNSGISEKIGKFEQVNPKYIESGADYTIINDRVFVIK